MSTKIIYRSGMRTIGGTIIELIKDNHRIIFDFGCVFDPKENQDIPPRVSGVYDNTSEFRDMILISHNHLDHIKALNLVNKEIDIYLSPESNKLLTGLKTIGFDQIMGEWRDYQTINPGTDLTFGPFVIRAYEVDHDIIGAVGYLIKTEDLTLFYTGDLRIHGLKSEKTFSTLAALKEEDIDLLIIEGVGISFVDQDFQFNPSFDLTDLMDTSKYLDSVSEKIITGKQVLFNPYIMNTELHYYYYLLAIQHNKLLALQPSTAKLFKMLTGIEDEIIFTLENDVHASGYPVVKLSDITPEYLVEFNFNQAQLYSTIPDQKILIHSGGEPLGDFDPRFQIYQEFCQNNGFVLENIGFSGHSYANNLAQIVKEINPKILSPIHSYQPEQMLKLGYKTILPSENEEIIFLNHEIINKK